MEHEIGGKTIQIPLDGFVEATGGDPIKLRKVGIQDDLLVPQQMDKRSNFFRDEQAAGDGGAGLGGDFLFCGHGSGVGGMLGGGVENGIVHFCDDLPDAEAEELLGFLLVHEALHVLLRHRQRFAHLRWKRTLNEAADYVINAMIVRRNRELKQEIFPPIDGIYLDESFSGHKSVEQIYRELILAKIAKRQKAAQSKTIRLLLRSRRRNRHVRSGHACPATRNLSGVAKRGIASRGGRDAIAMEAGRVCDLARGLAKLRVAALTRKIAHARAARRASVSYC